MLEILITDDHAMIRAKLKQVLVRALQSAVVGEAQNAEEALEAIRRKDWDLVMMDITMPGRSGLEVLKDIRLSKPALPVLIMSMHGEERFAVRVLKAGAAGFISKHSAPEELVSAVHKILGGGRYASSRASETLVFDLGRETGRPAHEQLSEREMQLFCMFASGKAKKQVAKDLSLSVRVVSTHRTRMLEKMKMTSNAEVTRYALKHGLVE